MDILILSEICSTLDTNVLELDLEASFIQNGGHSLNAATLVFACRAKGCHITNKSVLSNQSIRHLIRSAQAVQDTDAESPTKSRQLEAETSTAALSLSDRNYSTSSSYAQSETQTASVRASPLTQASETSDDLQVNQLVPSLHIGSQQASPLSVSAPYGREMLADVHLSFIYGSMKTPGMNIITYSETYYTTDIPAMKMAWETIVNTEPIFSSSAFNCFRREGCERFLWYEAPSAQSEEEAHLAVEVLRTKSHVGSAFHVFQHKPTDSKKPLSTITWIVHHAFVDGYSASLLLDKVRRVTAGMIISPSPPFSQLLSGLQELRRARSAEGNAYWADKLELSNLARGQPLLPRVVENRADDKIECAKMFFDIGPLRDQLYSFAQKISVTPAAIFNAAWALVLSKYADSEVVTFEVVLSGRDLPLADVRETIGPLINTLPLYVRIDDELSAGSFIVSVMKALTEVNEFQWTNPENGFSAHFESALAFQFAQFQAPKGSVQSVGGHYSQQTTEIPLSVMIERDSQIHMVYHRHRYSKTDMDRMATCYKQVLHLLLRGDIRIKSVLHSLLPLSSRRVLAEHGNCFSDRTSRTSITEDLVTLFERNAERDPESVAVEKGNLSLTYADLDLAAGQLAEHLSTFIDPGDVICTHSDRSINWIIAIYGILKAGGVYCSLDAGLPSELRNKIFLNAGAKAFILPYSEQRCVAPESCDQVIALDDVLHQKLDTGSHVTQHRREPKPSSTAYLCFTSGTTGTPKGVICTHEGLVAFQSELEVRLYARPGVRISQIMSPAFDGSIHEVFSALCYGATLVLSTRNSLFDHLTTVDSAILTPSIARVLDPKMYPRLANVYLVGEPVPQSINDKWAESKTLFNMYGPTEGTCGATIKRLMPGARVTIGKPNPTTRLYILDSQRQLAIPGVIGEIYLAGIQIAKGYLNLPDETKERFLPDTICSNGEEIYRTGDRGYWTECGEIVILGRSDRQIKLRGYRLDMNDIEARAARAFPGIEAIAVAPQGDYLVAMVQPASIDIGSFLTTISKTVPSYAIPRHILATDMLPTTGAGKIDYKAISETRFGNSRQEARGPRTSSEKVVAASFKAALELDERVAITAQSHFVDLGGHSLKQLSLSLHLTREFETRVPLKLIIEHPILEDLAKAIDILVSEEERPCNICTPILSEQSISPIEKNWLERYQLGAGASCFNVAFAGTFAKNKVDRAKLIDARNLVLARHSILRCRYITQRGKAPRRILSSCAPRVERVETLNLWSEVNRPFQLDRTSPIRVYVTEDQLVVLLSHIVADYTTLVIILREVSALYGGQNPRTVRGSYLETFQKRNVPWPCHLDFWTKYLDGWKILPALFGRDIERTSFRGTSLVTELLPSTITKIIAYAQSTGYTLQQLATAAVALCLQPDVPDTDLVIGTPYINRHSEEAFETIGLFLEPLPVRVKYRPGEKGQHISAPNNPFLESVRASSQAALAHAVPWHHLLDRLGIQDQPPNHPLSDVMVSVHEVGQTTSLSIAAAAGFEPRFLWSEGSKFKLMCELTMLAGGKALLRLEHDPECVRAEEVRMLRRCVPVVLEMLVEEFGCGEIKDRVKKMGFLDDDDEEVVRDYFGVRLSEI